MKILASGPITGWQIDEETMETVRYFILGGSKITADGDCNEIKRRLLLGKKVMTNSDSILKSRDITLPTKVHLVKAMVFPVLMYGCESWIIKKSWAANNWFFWTAVLEKSLESPLDCKEIKPVNPKVNQSWMFIGRTASEAPILCEEYTWCEELTHWKILWCWERWKAGGEGDDRAWDDWMTSSTRWPLVWASSGNWWWKIGGLQSIGIAKSWTPLSYWTELNNLLWFFVLLHCLL